MLLLVCETIITELNGKAFGYQWNSHPFIYTTNVPVDIPHIALLSLMEYFLILFSAISYSNFN